MQYYKYAWGNNPKRAQMKVNKEVESKLPAQLVIIAKAVMELLSATSKKYDITS